jgi:hypothetical protein
MQNYHGALAGRKLGKRSFQHQAIHSVIDLVGIRGQLWQRVPRLFTRFP